LDDDVGAVGLERHAVITVVDDRILDHNGVGAEGVPAVGVFGWILACALGRGL
jgi:hypothetical protein